MAIAAGATAVGNNGGTGNATWSQSVSGSDTMVVVIVNSLTANDVSGVTIDGAAMTQLGSSIDTAPPGATYFISFWYKLNPTAGSPSIVVSSSTNHYLICASALYTGVSQSGQPDAGPNTATNGNAIIAPSVSVVASNAWAIMGVAGNFNSGTSYAAGSATTMRVAGFGEQVGIADSGAGLSPGSNPHTLTVTQTGQTIGAIIGSFAPATGSSASASVSPSVSPSSSVSPSPSPSSGGLTIVGRTVLDYDF